MNNTEEFNATLPDMHRKRYGHAKKWTVIKPMSKPRFCATSVALGNNIVVMGGSGKKYDNLKSAKQYDTISKRWSTFPSMNEARYGHAAAILNGKIIVVGGCGQGYNSLTSVEQYDPVTQRWTFLPPMIHKRSDCSAAVLDGQLYVVGGRIFDDGNLRDLSSVEVYNTNTNSWSMIKNMKNRRSVCAAVAWNGKLIVSGGESEEKYLESVEIYDPKGCEWSSLPSMKTPRGYHTAVVVDGTLYAIGGWSEKGKVVSSMESLNY